MILTVVAALLTGTAGCSAAPDANAKSSASPSPTIDEMAAWRRFVACVRTHGAPNYPDPVRDPSTGKVGIPPGVDKPPRRSVTPCKHLLAAMASNRRPPVSAADLAKLREFSKCMRANGLRDWPDPTAEGEFELNKRLSDLGKRGHVEQMRKCSRLVPGGKIAVKTEGDR
jgi:hypothetical protein